MSKTRKKALLRMIILLIGFFLSAGSLCFLWTETTMADLDMNEALLFLNALVLYSMCTVMAFRLKLLN